jgi:signal transduction histidine kinase
MKEKFPRLLLWSSERIEPFINQFGQDLGQARDLLPKSGTVVGKLSGIRVRLTRGSIGQFTAMAISADADRLKSRVIMDREIETILAAAPVIEITAQRSEQRARRLIHNLKSLTAKTNQEIFYVLQQDRMLNLNKDALPYVEQEIGANIREASKAFIEILKHQSAQKAEFFAFEKLSGKVDVLRVEPHSVHSVLMNVFYLFFGDFVDRKVRAKVEQTHQVARFDYDSIHACIYYLVENAAKYTSRNSSMNVTVSVDSVGGMVDIRFDMESLSIAEDEQERVFEEGYSGRRAIERGLSGAGIGLFQAREMARLNGGDLYLIAGRPMNGEYARNAFTITLPI